MFAFDTIHHVMKVTVHGRSAAAAAVTREFGKGLQRDPRVQTDFLKLGSKVSSLNEQTARAEYFQQWY